MFSETVFLALNRVVVYERIVWSGDPSSQVLEISHKKYICVKKNTNSDNTEGIC